MRIFESIRPGDRTTGIMKGTIVVDTVNALTKISSNTFPMICHVYCPSMLNTNLERKMVKDPALHAPTKGGCA